MWKCKHYTDKQSSEVQCVHTSNDFDTKWNNEKKSEWSRKELKISSHTRTHACMHTAVSQDARPWLQVHIHWKTVYQRAFSALEPKIALDTFVAFDCLSNNIFCWRCVLMRVCVAFLLYYIIIYTALACTICLTFFVSSLGFSLSLSSSLSFECTIQIQHCKANMAQIVKRKPQFEVHTIECYQYDGKILKIYNWMYICVVNILPAFSFAYRCTAALA